MLGKLNWLFHGGFHGVCCYILQCVGMSQNWANMEKSVCHHPEEKNLLLKIFFIEELTYNAVPVSPVQKNDLVVQI